MDFAFTPDQENLRAHLRKLLDEACPPEYAACCDRYASPPRAAYEALAILGWIETLGHRPIGQFQAISHKLADMKMMLDVSRTLVYWFAWLMSQGQASRHDAAVLKLYIGEIY